MDQERLYTLLTREIANELTPAEAEELQQLLQQYPHASYIREVFTKPWQETSYGSTPEQLKQMQARHLQRLQTASSSSAATIPDDVTTTTPVRRLWWRVASVAASIALIAFTGWKLLYRPATQPLPLEKLVTSKGTRSQLLLPDGSHVWLNAGSKLNYPPTFAAGQPRMVELEGEAFFEIATDVNRPFRVKTKSFTILVLGTSFNVRAYPEEDSAVTALVNGAVEVQLDQAGQQKILLRPNEKLTVPAGLYANPDDARLHENETGKLQIPIYKQQLTQVRDSIVSETAWVKNKLAFKHLELEKVTALLEQWYGVEIDFHNEEKKRLYFTGMFETDNLDEVLDALTSTGSFTYTKDARGKIWIE